MNIFSCAASVLKMLEGSSSSTYQALTQLTFTCSKSTIETLEKG